MPELINFEIVGHSYKDFDFFHLRNTEVKTCEIVDRAAVCAVCACVCERGGGGVKHIVNGFIFFMCSFGVIPHV